jgi:iron-sulfur cluster assembly protein
MTDGGVTAESSMMATATTTGETAEISARGPRARKPIQAMQVTESAGARVRALIDGRGKPTAGIRIGVRSKGCSGLSYTLEFADEKSPFDEVVEAHGVTLLIDPKAMMFILGTEMDYVEEQLQSGFVFRNPNEKGRCGCGESFHV